MLSKFFTCIIIYSQVCLANNNTNFTTYPDANLYWVPRVVNGSPAKKGDVPYQVALKSLTNRHRNLYRTFCGASILHQTKLLTAAHCVSGSKGISDCSRILFPGKVQKSALKGVYAVAGNLYNTAPHRYDSDEDGQWRSLYSGYYPKKYKFPMHDIAVLFLRRAFIFNSYVAPIPMATWNTDYIGSCLVSGFGRTGRHKHEQTEVLLLAHLDIMPKRRCSQLHRSNMDTFVCTSSYITDVGKGDSGGPLVCANTGDPNEKDRRGVLVGVVSGHRTGIGSFFTRVSRYQHFIAKSKSVSIKVLVLYKYFQIITVATIMLVNKIFFLF